MKYVKLDENGDVLLDEENLPISTGRLVKIRKYPQVERIIRALEDQNILLRGVVPVLILIVLRADPRKFTFDSILFSIVMLLISSEAITGFMLAYLGCWNISSRGFRAIIDKDKRREFFSKIENVKKRRGEGIFFFYGLFPGFLVLFWDLPRTLEK